MVLPRHQQIGYNVMEQRSTERLMQIYFQPLVPLMEVEMVHQLLMFPIYKEYFPLVMMEEVAMTWQIQEEQPLILQH